MSKIKKGKQRFLSDQEIIEEIRKGNGHYFRELVLRYESQIAATVIGMLGYGPEADEVGQEVFVRFYKNIHQFRGDAALVTYLTRIAINLSLNELKRRKRRALIFFRDDNNTLPDLAAEPEHFNDPDTPQLVNAAVQKLDAKQRAVVVLRLIEGYSTEETARMLNIPLGTVLSRLARAQKKLRKILAPYFEDYNE